MDVLRLPDTDIFLIERFVMKLVNFNESIVVYGVLVSCRYCENGLWPCPYSIQNSWNEIYNKANGIRNDIFL